MRPRGFHPVGALREESPSIGLILKSAVEQPGREDAKAENKLVVSLRPSPKVFTLWVKRN